MKTAQKSETPLAGGVTQQELKQADERIIGDDPVRIKRFATLQAQLALRGFQLQELSTGGFLISAWCRTAHAPDLRGVQAFLERIT